MEEQKNRNHENSEEDYYFLKEVIKKKPVDKKRVLLTALGILGGAVLFGGVASFTFAKMLPHFQEDPEPAKVSIPEETPIPTPEETPEPTEAAEEPETGQKEEIDVSVLYQKAMQIIEEPERSLVTVQGITNNVDWMNNSYENYTQISGLLAADSGEDYFILTEYRVVDQVDRILVTFCDGAIVDAHFQKKDPATGLAVLKVSHSEVDKDTRKAIAVASLGSSTGLDRGEPVLALGSPAGYGGAVSYGMVTSVKNMKSTVDNEYHLLTTDIMGSGEGSGVLVSTDGKIVGVIEQSFSMDDDKNVVTALPITELRKLIEQLSNKEDLIYLGVRGQNIGNELSEKTGIPRGIYVNAVEEDSPAMVSGIQNGDVITKVGGDSIETLTRLRSVLDKHKKDEKVQVSVMRKGAEGYVEIVFDVTLGAL